MTLLVATLGFPNFCFSFLNHIFSYDHQERLSAKEASAHPYFAVIREAAARSGGVSGLGVFAT